MAGWAPCAFPSSSRREGYPLRASAGPTEAAMSARRSPRRIGSEVLVQGIFNGPAMVDQQVDAAVQPLNPLLIPKTPKPHQFKLGIK